MASKNMLLERRYGDELPTSLLARTITRRTLAWFRLASLAKTEIVFPRLPSWRMGGEVKLDRDGLTNRKERTHSK
jgi:hypothetical protein